MYVYMYVFAGVYVCELTSGIMHWYCVYVCVCVYTYVCEYIMYLYCEGVVCVCMYVHCEEPNGGVFLCVRERQAWNEGESVYE